ncbi:hypothetical protein RvY_15485 [Ramazzottius varieornatus]|uniref:Uncharacterized protein n=1 Tax=Ramazzottius varieornatus TaxID=947166 RepID=A0A1D1VWN2_RAMVA|nr:hypothetical protein RvY_15485 [Ramazzottius varieornatus]
MASLVAMLMADLLSTFFDRIHCDGTVVERKEQLCFFYGPETNKYQHNLRINEAKKLLKRGRTYSLGVTNFIPIGAPTSPNMV